MQTSARSATKLMQGSLMIVAAFTPVTASALTAVNDMHRADLPVERRLVVTIGPLDAAPLNGQRSVSVRMPHAATLHRFRAELIDASGQMLGPDLFWGVTFFTATPLAESYEGPEAMARLSTGRADLQLPRPYGHRLDEGDSMTIVAALPVSGAYGAVLRITMDYESAPTTRLPAVALVSHESVASGCWIWRPDVSGRIVAIAGRQLVGAEELLLEDVTTGRVIWRDRAQVPVPGVAVQQREVVRPSVAVQAGRIYRMRAIYVAAAPQPSFSGDTPLAIVFPDRPSQR